MSDVMRQLSSALQAEAARYPTVTEFARQHGLDYQEIYPLLRGARVNGVNVELLRTLMRRFASVKDIFVGDSA